GGSEKTAANDSRPEAVVAREELSRRREAEIEHLELVSGAGEQLDVRPSSRNLAENHEEAENSTRDVEEHLHDIGPNHGRESAFESVEQGCADDHRDGDHFARTEDDRDDNRDREDPDTF